MKNLFVQSLISLSVNRQVVCVVPKWLRMNDIPEEDRRMEINEAFDLLKASGVKQDDEKLRRISENKTNKAFEELVFENQQWRTFPYLLGHLPDFENWLNANSKLKPTVKVSEGLQLLGPFTQFQSIPNLIFQFASQSDKWIRNSFDIPNLSTRVNLIASSKVGHSLLLLRNENPS